MSFWELVIFVLGLACPRTGILPFFRNNRFWNKVFLLFFQYAIFFANKNTVEYAKVTLWSM